jgi:deoxyribodipyrimidine photo-lyase
MPHEPRGEDPMVQPERIKPLNRQPVLDGKYVVYWMQQSQRAEYNHALEHAVERANALDKPLIVYFGITDRFPEANERHYSFMLQGLQETQDALARRNIQLVIRHEAPREGVLKLTPQACLLVADRGYLKVQREWRQHAATRAPCLMEEIESDVIVPVEVASNKEEYAAATIRRKIHRHLDDFLVPLRQTAVKRSSLRMTFAQFGIGNLDRALRRLKINRDVPGVAEFTGGTARAKRLLEDFIREKLSRFAAQRNDPARDVLSLMSPYLHFGQISPLYIALQVLAANRPGKHVYLEELIVRRELSMNFVYYNANYATFEGLPAWARATLRVHQKDPRTYLYRPEELEHARTHDPYWNAAQQEMVRYGKMHGYMRMYWGKKIIEWTRDPEEAFEICLHLNNKYELDGRDANGYTGVAWCFGKHDRAWS